MTHSAQGGSRNFLGRMDGVWVDSVGVQLRRVVVVVVVVVAWLAGWLAGQMEGYIISVRPRLFAFSPLYLCANCYSSLSIPPTSSPTTWPWHLLY